MWPEVLESIIGRTLEGTERTVEGFRRMRVKGEHYPVVIPHEGGSVTGRLYSGLTEEDVKHLDQFEGEAYDRIEILVDGEMAQIYVLSERWMHIADSEPWHPEQLGDSELEAFRQEYKGWGDIN